VIQSYTRIYRKLQTRLSRSVCALSRFQPSGPPLLKLLSLKRLKEVRSTELYCIQLHIHKRVEGTINSYNNTTEILITS
jgi:hypothetical protein